MRHLMLIVLFCYSFLGLSQEGDLRLIWSDEFDYTGPPDESKWSYDHGDGCPSLSGWGNNELQTYTSRPVNVEVRGGSMIITARREEFAGRNYTSARVVSRRKGDWTYGRIEVRALLPKGIGTWPAIWMLPTDWWYGSWPDSGEIDIMEHVGFDPGNVHASIHTRAYNHLKGTQRTSSRKVEDFYSEFHVYALEWRPDELRFFIDDTEVMVFRNDGSRDFATWPFDQRFHLIANIAVGGNWGGIQGVDISAFPASLEIDYVRVYEPSSVVTSVNHASKEVSAWYRGRDNSFILNVPVQNPEALYLTDLQGRTYPFTIVRTEAKSTQLHVDAILEEGLYFISSTVESLALKLYKSS